MSWAIDHASLGDWAWLLVAACVGVFILAGAVVLLVRGLRQDDWPEDPDYPSDSEGT